MKWILIFWIFECSGPACPIPVNETRVFKTEPECFKALNAWQAASKKNRAICLRDDSSSEIEAKNVPLELERPQSTPLARYRCTALSGCQPR